MLVFVSSPYRGNAEHNVTYAQNCCAYEMTLGNTPIAPHLLLPQFTDDDELGIQHGLTVLERCDEVHIWGKPSNGMRMEIDHALANGIPVIYMTGGDDD